MSSTSDKLSGKFNQVVGKISGNEEVAAKGRIQEDRGKLKGKLKNVGEAISHKIDDAARK